MNKLDELSFSSRIAEVPELSYHAVDQSDEVRRLTRCRGCDGANLRPILSLGASPLANELVPANAPLPDRRYPLELVYCPDCTLLQLEHVVSPVKLFEDYVYFSSNSETMLTHSRRLVQQLVEQESLGGDSLAVEIASNDGYLLQYFKRVGVPVLGIEPARNIAEYAEREKGIATIAEFFGSELAAKLAAESRRADVIIGNNVLAHVPGLRDFIAGVRTLLKPSGVAVFEFPYVKNMLDGLEFDTIYHEHQCYFSLSAIQRLCQDHGLEVADVRRSPIHGGSLRVFMAAAGSRPVSPRVPLLLKREAGWGVDHLAPYAQFAQAVKSVKTNLLALLDGIKAKSQRIAAYGAAAKGVTLTNYCGIGQHYLDYVVDRSTHKQGMRFPVDGLPIYSPERLLDDRPPYTLLLVWNFATEVLRQQATYRALGGKFIIPVPEPRVVE